MNRAAAFFSLLCLSACSDAGPHITLGPVPPPDEKVLTITTAAPTEADIADDARAFFFNEIDKYISNPIVEAGGHQSQMLSLLGREDLIGAPEASDRLPACQRRWVDPVRTIREAARNKQIVIISEATDEPRHRNFISAMVAGLYEDGFSVYASETLSLSDGGVHDPELPLLTEGLIARDPMHGRMLRRVKALDMRIVDFQPTHAERLAVLDLPVEERVPAMRDMHIRNLTDRIFDETPDARSIIHISRSPLTDPGLDARSTGAEDHWMQARLREETDIEALTISQTDCYAPMPRSVAVPLLANGRQGFHKSDLMIGHPVEAYIGGRPAWRRNIGDTPVSIPVSLLGTDAPLIIEARREGEPAHTVPDDRLLLLPGENMELLLPAGTYRIEGWTKNGPVAEPVSITVE